MDGSGPDAVSWLTLGALLVAIAVGVVAMLGVTAIFLAHTKRVRLALEPERLPRRPEPDDRGPENDWYFESFADAPRQFDENDLAWQAFVDERVDGDEDDER
jgi:hypothetical protein